MIDVGRATRGPDSRIGRVGLPDGFVDELRAELGVEHVITAPEQLATYDCDGLTGWRARPACVVLPGAAGEVQAVLRLCARDGVPFVARGAGTGLSGGALREHSPRASGGIVQMLAHFLTQRSTAHAHAV